MQTNMHKHAEHMQVANVKTYMYMLSTRQAHVFKKINTFKVHPVHQGSPCHFHSALSCLRHGPVLFFLSLSSNPLFAASCRYCLYPHSNTHSVAWISLYLCDWFNYQYITNKWVYMQFTCHTRLMALILRYFYDNRKETKARLQHSKMVLLSKHDE